MKAGKKPKTWAEIQAEYADMPGAAGVEARRKHYAPYFLRLGRDVVIEEGCRFYHPDRIVLDDDARINIGALVYGSGGLWIGRHARIGPRFFVHSANHDVEDGPTAFFERGYDYFPTVIGDNVLISANVSVMPGAILGNSTFVAAGAVVPAGRYQQRTRLFGVPAVQKLPLPAEITEEAPEIAFLVPAAGERKDAVTHLLSALGLPQVGVIENGEHLPESLHSVILHGPPDWDPPVADGVEVWKLAGADDVVSGEEAWFDAPSGVRIALPVRVETSVVPDGREGEDRWVRALEQTLFWLTTRLSKGAGPVTADEAREWETAFTVLGVDHRRNDRLRERIEDLIEKRLPSGKAGKRAELVFSAANSDAGDEKLVGETAKLVAAARNGADLIASGVAAALLGENTIVEQVRKTLETPEWRVAGIAMPRSAAGAKGFCYSPLVLAWLFLEARRADPAFRIPDGIGAPHRLARPLEWRPAHGGGGLMDERTRSISPSLLNNWLVLHQAPCPSGSQVVLEDFNYGQMTAPLETAWREIFLFLQGRKDRPLVRVNPWPAGRRAAVSLRYDVDRPVNSKTISDIVRGQAELANSPCGSWYFFGGRAASEGQARQLAHFWQEIAIHAEDPDEEPVDGLGVTHHSAPTSMYWRGDRTNSVLDERGADYCEFLNVQTAFPRPGWITGSEARLAACWTTPIHFPLEGSTSDTDLDYFDQRLDRFRALIVSGGHGIIGTHPDLNQALMDSLLAREEIHDIWFAPVGTVVDRCRQVMSCGAIRCVRHPSGGISLLSRESLADVSLEIRSFGSDGAKNLTVQLEAERPRHIELEA